MNGKQKRIFLKERRLAKRVAALPSATSRIAQIPKGAVLADRLLHAHISSYGFVECYVDQSFTCRGCGIDEIWKATAQKRYVEIYKGHFDARAIRCRICRQNERERKANARAQSEEGLRLKLTRLQNTSPATH
jgi:Probable zinc-ribbon domain